MAEAMKENGLYFAPIEETTQQKFMKFFNAKFDERCQQIENAYEPMISKAIENTKASIRNITTRLMQTGQAEETLRDFLEKD